MFRTELTIAPATGQLPRTARVLTVGSCFADSIGSRLTANKVNTLVNPFGTVFQPLALARLLRAAAGEEVDWQQHLVEARGRWQSYDLHSTIGADSPVELLQTIQELVRRTGDFLRQADVVLLTLGTAWAYRLRETGELVNNCHKQSADLFVRELLTPDEIINALAETHAYLRRINPELRFVLTVSPVRHLKDTLQLNSVSKSVLRLATHIVSDLLPGVAYFPAFELLMDDLRDYRFYAEDMLHPSEVAQDYVWEKFTRAYFDADFGRFRKEWAAVRQSLGHRPLHVGAPEHRQFLENTREKLEQLSLRKVDVTEELRTVRTQLAALPVPTVPQVEEFPTDDEERIDIGEETGILPVAEAEKTTANGRPPRLSPEEFRAQRAARPDRGRRDGRGKGQQASPTENEQFQTAALTTEDAAAAPQSLPTPAMASESAALPIHPLELTTALQALDTEAEAETTNEEPAKKKKRRSRGGAKRTARKNALRLAAGEAGEISQTAEGSTDLIPEAAGEPADTIAVTESQVAEAVTDESEANAETRAVKRGGRRGEGNRVPRVALFATEAVPTDDNLSATEANNQSDNQSEAGTQAALASAPVVVPDAVTTGDSGNVVTLEENSNDSTATETVLEASPTRQASARQPRRKARAATGGRAEKPAVDTPVIPVIDATQVRTQVAAGRMTGTSASLIAPTVPSAKVAVSRKAVATKARPAAASANKVVEAPSAAVAPESATTAPMANPVTIPASKPRAAAKPKTSAPKVAPEETKATEAPVAAVVKKSPGKKAAVKSTTGKKANAEEVTTPKATKPVAAAAKPTVPKKAAAKKAEAKPATAKAKPTKKPTKPA